MNRMSVSLDKHKLSAIVLAGGKSSRLGRDKTRVRINGLTMVQNTLALAREFCSSTYVVGQRQDQEEGILWMLDDIPGIGPMGGIITALQNLGGPCLVLACDLPCLKKSIISRLIEYRNRKGRDLCMTAYLQQRTGHIEALVSVYEQASLDLLLASYRQGCYKLSRAIPAELRLHIPYGPDEEQYFFNVNYPEDLKKMSLQPAGATGTE